MKIDLNDIKIDKVVTITSLNKKQKKAIWSLKRRAKYLIANIEEVKESKEEKVLNALSWKKLEVAAIKEILALIGVSIDSEISTSENLTSKDNSNGS